MELEICANSYRSAINAQKAGADSIELCSELSVGGITPSYGLLKKVSEAITIPVNILIRPRSGHFCYTDDEFLLMKENIKLCKELGFHGIVSGVLNPDNTIDIGRTKELISVSYPLSFTFHRAFDCVKNSKAAVKILIDLGVESILTSGKQNEAKEGIELLKELRLFAENNIVILPGSGINATNARIFRDAGFHKIHSSASQIKATEKSIFFGDTIQTVSDITNIKEILKVIKNA
jgi:copper homeostasis protein